MTLEEVAAHLEIQQVLYRYCRGVDRGDAALIAGVYHPDATDDHGSWVGPGRAFGEYLVPVMDQAAFVGQHHITNALIEVEGQAARVESYFVAFHPGTGQADSPRHIMVCGRYVDRFERRDGAWKIADRRVVIDVSRVLSDGADWVGGAAFPAGGRRGADPSSRHFGGSF
jgi:hypothetical protein